MGKDKMGWSTFFTCGHLISKALSLPVEEQGFHPPIMRSYASYFTSFSNYQKKKKKREENERQSIVLSMHKREISHPVATKTCLYKETLLSLSLSLSNDNVQQICQESLQIYNQIIIYQKKKKHNLWRKLSRHVHARTHTT